MDTRKRTLFASQMTPGIDLEQNQRCLLPELSLLGQRNLSQQSLLPDISLLDQGHFNQTSTHSMVSALRNSTNAGVQHIPDHVNGVMPCGISQYNGYGIQYAQDTRVPTAEDPSFSYLASPSATEQLPSSRNYGLIGMPADAHARNCHFIEEIGCPYKRRFTERAPVNFQYLNSAANSQSSNAPFNLMHSYARSHWTVGDYMVQHLQPVGDALWLDQHLNSNFESRGAWTWNQTSAVSATHGFQHPPSTFIQHSGHQYPLPALPLRGRGQNSGFYPQLAAAIYGIPLSSEYGIMYQRLELNPRDVPLTDYMAYCIHQDYVIPEPMFQHHPISQMRVLQEDEVAMLEAQAADSEDVGDVTDLYGDMRLDIEQMSYEELLALEEEIGNVRTGLSEETIMSRMKTRNSIPLAWNINLEEPASENEETDSCTICLDVIYDGMKIGILDCEHYYHADCLKQWLLVKNVCPICKSEAFDLSKER